MDFLNGLGQEARQWVVKVANNMFDGESFSTRGKFILKCAYFSGHLVENEHQPYEVFLIQKLNQLLGYNSWFSLCDSDKLTLVSDTFSRSRFIINYFWSQYETVSRPPNWLQARSKFDLSQFVGEGKFPWDTPGEQLIALLAKAPKAKDYPGLAVPQGVLRKQVLDIHRAFTNSLQCLDVLDKPYLCELEVFAKLAKTIFQRMVTENAAEYIPKDEIKDFHREISSTETMNFLDFTLLMDRLSILLTHPGCRIAQAVVTNIPYDYYSTWLSSRRPSYFLDHYQYVKLVATSGNRFTRQFSSTLAQATLFPDIALFPYLFSLTNGELLECLALPKGTVLLDCLKKHNISHDNFRPTALTFGPIDHDTHVKASPAHFRAHDGQHEQNIRIHTSTLTSLRLFKEEGTSLKAAVLSHNFYARAVQAITRQHALYYSIIESLKIFVSEEKKPKQRQVKEYYAIKLAHDFRVCLKVRVEYLLKPEQFSKQMTDGRYNHFTARYYKPLSYLEPISELSKLESAALKRKLDLAAITFIAQFQTRFPELISALDKWYYANYYYICKVRIDPLAYKTTYSGIKKLATQELNYGPKKVPVDYYQISEEAKKEYFLGCGVDKPKQESFVRIVSIKPWKLTPDSAPDWVDMFFCEGAVIPEASASTIVF